MAGAALLFFVTFGVNTAAAVDLQQEIIAPAQQYVGARYCHGGTDLPCFDCSGFVRNVYAPLVPEIPRISNDMARFGAPVDRTDLRPGDLVFFTTGTRRDVVTHVAIFIGQDSIIHAISDGPNRGVTVTPLSARYWRTRYHSARRVVRVEQRAEPQREETTQTIEYALGSYTGELEDGVPHGNGRMDLHNGDVYEGAFVQGEFHGRGEYRWASGEAYRGEFVRGEMVTAEPTQETYMETATSPWDTWDGVVEGDFRAWLQQEQDAFEEWKRNN
jgi:hypothetical protein